MSVSHVRLTILTLMLLALPWGLGAQPSASPCQNPTLTVKPEEDLQQAIDQAPEGAVLQLLGSGYPVRLSITKSLTLCGQGPTETQLGRLPASRVLGIPVVHIESPQPIQVTLQDLTISASLESPFRYDLEDHTGLIIGGRAQVRLQNVWVQNNRYLGILISGSAVVSLSKVRITQNGFNPWHTGSGIAITSQVGQVTIEDAHIFENARDGISVSNSFPSLSGPLQVTIRRSYIYANNLSGMVINANSREGSRTSGHMRVTIEDSNIFLNHLGAGIDISAESEDEAHAVSLSVSIANSIISANGGMGVWISPVNRASQMNVELRRVTVQSNGADLTQCLGPKTLDGLFCNGILVDGEEGTRVVIADSVIRWNSGWGIAVRLKKCNSEYIEETFQGQLLLEGNNVIEGNNTAGYHQGEVCLP